MKAKHFTTNLFKFFYTDKSHKSLMTETYLSARKDHYLLLRSRPANAAGTTQATYRSVTACIH